jgi:hypothetical protein
MKCDWWRLKPGETCESDGTIHVGKLHLCQHHYDEYRKPPPMTLTLGGNRVKVAVVAAPIEKNRRGKKARKAAMQS